MKRKTYNQKPEVTMKRSWLHASRFTLHEKGITIYLAMITLSAALATALYVSSIFVKEYKISNNVINGMNAVYVADSAMEYALYQVRLDNFSVASTSAPILPSSTCGSTLLGITGVACSINAKLVDHSINSICPTQAIFTAPNCIDIVATGSYGNLNRAIEIIFDNL